MHRPPSRNTPHNVKHRPSNFALAVAKSVVPLYIMSRTIPNENGTAIVTLDDTTKNPMAPVNAIEIKKIKMLLENDFFFTFLGNLGENKENIFC